MSISTGSAGPTVAGIHVKQTRDLTLRAAGDIVAGNKIIHNHYYTGTPQQDIAKAPYKFLASYDISDRDIFFGRDAVIEELTGKIPRHKVLIINGQSGSGKTSLINAGLIPRLVDNGYLYVCFREYSNPLEQLREYFRNDHDFAIEDAAGMSLQQILRAFRSAQRNSPVVVILDQFERFLINVEAKPRHVFFQQLQDCLMGDLTTAELNLVISIRADFYGPLLLSAEEVIPSFGTYIHPHNLRTLDVEEARQAIVRPIENISNIFYEGAFVDEVLVPHLVSESRGESRIDPPHLQIVCNQLFEEACRYARKSADDQATLIGAALYDKLGKTAGLLRDYLDDEVYRVGGADAQQVGVVRSILKLMIDSLATRKFVSLQTICRDLVDVSCEEIACVIEELQECRVVAVRYDDSVRTYSLSHEIMVSKVESWFDEREMGRRRANETLQRGLAEWRNSKALLQKSQVEIIRRWLADDSLVQARELLNKSEQAIADQERHAEEQQHKLETARRRIKYALIGGVLAAAILIIVAIIFAIRAQVILKRAVEERRQTQRVQSLFLADLSRQVGGSLRPTIASSASTATLLALEALPDSLAPGYDAISSRPYVREAEARLVYAVSELREKLIIEVSEGHVYDALASPDGKRLLTRGWSPDAELWSTTGERLTILGPHDGTVSDAVFLPSGDAVLTGSRQARLWSTETGNLIRFYGGHERPVNSVAFSPDLRSVATSSGDLARVFNLETGELRAVLKGHRDVVWSARFSPDSTRIVTSSWDKSARLWNAETGEELAVLESHDGVVSKAMFNGDGTLVATVSGAIYGGEDDRSDYSARLWRVIDGEPMHVLKGHKSFVTDAVFGPEGQDFVTISADGTARIWDTMTGVTVALLRHGDSVNSVAFSPNGKYISTASDDDMAYIWDADTGERLITLRGHESHVMSARFSPDGNALITSSLDGTVRLWRMGGHQVGHTMSAIDVRKLAREGVGGYGEAGSIRAVEISKDSGRIVTLFKEFPARLWDLEDGRLIGQLDHPGSRREADWTVTPEIGDRFPVVEKQHVALGAVFSRDGDRVATWGTDGATRVWDTRDGQLLGSFSEGTIMSADGRRMIVANEDGIVVSGVETGDVRLLVNGSHRVAGTIFNRDGSRVYVFINSGDIEIFDVETGQFLSTLKGHESRVGVSAFDKTGERLVTGDEDGIVILWDTEGIEELVRFSHDGDSVERAILNSDGSRLLTITGPGDYVARLWNVGDGTLLGEHDNVWSWSGEFSETGNIVTFYANTALIWNGDMTEVISTIELRSSGDLMDAAFSPDGKRLVTASRAGAVNLWDVLTGLEISTFRGHTSSVTHVEFLSGGRRILSASLDGTARMWPVLPGGQQLIDLAKGRLPASRARLSEDEQRRFFLIE